MDGAVRGYQPSEKALVLSLLEMVINGVSTRKVARITEELCGRDFKRFTVSDLAKQLDFQVEAWSERPLEGVFPLLIVDALQIKVRRRRRFGVVGCGLAARFLLPYITEQLMSSVGQSPYLAAPRRGMQPRCIQRASTYYRPKWLLTMLDII